MAHPDLNELFNDLIPFAERMLEEHGEFYPFGAMMRSNGEIALLGGETESDRPRSQEILDLLVGALRDYASRGEIRAAGICLDMRITPPEQSDEVDAICARLEHSSGEQAEVFVPYSKVDGRHILQEPFAQRGEPRIFGSDDPNA